MIQNADDKKGPKLVTNKKTGRNDPCPCGSGKKYKQCCLKKKTAEDAIKVETMLRLLYCFVEGVEGSSIVITKRTLDRMPKDWAERLEIKIGEYKNKPSYNVSVKQDPKKVITTPNKTIVGPNGRPL